MFLKWDISKQENAYSKYHGMHQLNGVWTVRCQVTDLLEGQTFGTAYCILRTAKHFEIISKINHFFLNIELIILYISAYTSDKAFLTLIAFIISSNPGSFVNLLSEKNTD